MQTGVEVKVGDLVRMLERLGVDATAKAAPVLTRMVGEHQRAMRERFRGYTGRRGAKLQIRSGNIQRAIQFEGARPGQLRAASFIAGPLRYAQLQEDGGTIRPRRGRFLTIPLPAALTSAGVVRKAAKPRKVGGQWETSGLVPGAADRSTFILSKSKGPVIYARGANGRAIPLWSLKRSVTIPPRLQFFKTWEKLEGRRAKQLGEFLGKAIRNARTT